MLAIHLSEEELIVLHHSRNRLEYDRGSSVPNSVHPLSKKQVFSVFSSEWLACLDVEHVPVGSIAGLLWAPPVALCKILPKV